MSKKTISPVRSTLKAASGAGVLIGALIALAFFRGGIGLGEGNGKEGEESLASVSTDSTVTTPTKAPAQERKDSAPAEPADGLAQEERTALASGQLTVLIDERSYLIKTNSDGLDIYQPLQMERAVELASRTKGDANGIRVVIQRRESSRASAENTLRNQLLKAGIGENAIHMPGSFIP